MTKYPMTKEARNPNDEGWYRHKETRRGVDRERGDKTKRNVQRVQSPVRNGCYNNNRYLTHYL
ncbi:MAG: hypothetical protein QF473_03010 [Planctomycetota bacterium]|nr:hypothetical protein [Planctomycetota bacterium]